jgi:hypothetical protein
VTASPEALPVVKMVCAEAGGGGDGEAGAANGARSATGSKDRLDV